MHLQSSRLLVPPSPRRLTRYLGAAYGASKTRGIHSQILRIGRRVTQ